MSGDRSTRGAGTASTSTLTPALMILWRDLFVTWREMPAFLAQVLLQPVFLLFVFGQVLGSLGFLQEGYAELLFPGIVALTAFLTALQTTALPLVIDFSFSKEIEDRLLAPTPTTAVALEKMAFSTLRALVASAAMFPLGVWILGGIPWEAGALGWVVLFVVLGALTGAAGGLTLGTLVPPSKINIVFALVLTPLLFTGAAQYPWASLEVLPWFQVVTALNPLTYVSEGLRGSLLPATPHVPAWVCVLALLGFLALLTATGIRGFLRRALD
ncbi:ABC transporter permease [uncultured Pseudokineococcus sp.]|uniref:ABC transporter permease n=1 Tax=uncultured Pseudokineococcus sp. TaxID=1642928 RepID=UPI002617C6F8|nr:ABC transporter permease [uncultured Pseudokineococcus sp.]